MTIRAALALVAAILAPPLLSSQGSSVDVQVLAINDLHGALEPPAESHAAGGIQYLASHLARLKSANPHTVIVSAGDNIGASPLVSGLFHDEPTIEALGAAGLQLSAVGNHELDEGWTELLRMQNGGCHPRDGCQDGTPFDGASFQFLSANVRFDPRRVDPAALAASGRTGGDTLFPPYAVREFEGVKVGFIGLTLRRAPDALPASARELIFEGEAKAANSVVGTLRRQGVRAIVVLIHEGGRTRVGAADECATLSGEIVKIVRDLSSEIDVVVSGHTHRAYTCTIGRTLVTSADMNGRVISDIDLTVDRRSGDVVSKAARNVVVTRDVEPDLLQSALVARYQTLAAKVALRPAGAIAATISRQVNAAGESPLGDIIADSMLAASSDPTVGGAVVAFVNMGGIRSDLTRVSDADGGAAGAVTYADLFRVQPFGNQLLVKTLTGDALLRTLEQQFDNPTTGADAILQVSAGFSYRYNRSRPRGRRVDRASVRLGGRPIDPRARYRVGMSDFLWSGGDGFTAVLEGTETTPVVSDIDAFVSYVQAHSPLAPGVPSRIQRDP